MFAAAAAHLLGRLQADAKGGTLRLAEDLAAVVVGQLHAAHACRFPMRNIMGYQNNLFVQ